MTPWMQWQVNLPRDQYLSVKADNKNYYNFSSLLIFALFLVHFGGGSWGLIAVAFFDSSEGIFYAQDLKSAYVSGIKLDFWSFEFMRNDINVSL